MKRKINLEKFKKFRYFLNCFIVFAIFIYLLLFIFMIIYQDRFLYHPSDESFYECDEFENYDKKNFNGTRFYYKDSKLNEDILIYYHGNSGRACDRAFLSNIYERYASSVIFVEYSGYGGDGQEPSLDLLKQDVKNIINFTQNYSKINVVGESLGTSLAAYHSYNTEVDVLLLLAPFYSTSSLGEEVFHYYPISFLTIENYDTANWIRNYENKLVMVHGVEDRNIPYTQAINLYNNSLSEDKHLFLLPYAKHNDLYGYGNTRRAIRYSFLEDYESDSLEKVRYNSSGRIYWNEGE